MHNKKTKTSKKSQKQFQKRVKMCYQKCISYKKFFSTTSLMQNSVTLKYKYYWMQHPYRPDTLSGFRCVLGKQPCCNCHRLRKLIVEFWKKYILAKTIRKPCPTCSKIRCKISKQTQLHASSCCVFSFFLFYIMYH